MGLMAANSDQNQCSRKAVTPSLGTYKVICVFCNPELSVTLIFDGSVWNKIISFRFSHPSNAHPPISVTDSEMLMLVSALHLANAHSLISVTVSGMLMLVSASHSSNALSPISVTDSGITVLVQPCIRRFAFVSMMALQLPRESYTLFPSATIILVSALHPLYLLLVDYQCYTL